MSTERLDPETVTPACWVVVSELPAAGKSTLAKRLADALAWPFIDKDDHLEALFDTHLTVAPEQRGSLSRQADALFQTAALKAGSAVITSWWRHPASTRDSGTPTEWLLQHDRRLIEVHCACPATLALRRFMGRQRHPGHGDGLRRSQDLMTQFQTGETLGPLFPDLSIVCPTATPVPALEVQALAQTVRRLAGAADCS